MPIRVDRLRAAQQLDGRTWSEIAGPLATTHQRLYHLSAGEGPTLRRCRRELRDGFASLLDVPPEWLSGETDALPSVPSADATVVAVSFPHREEVHTRVSLFQGTGRAVPGLQLALSRLLTKADRAVARDLAAAPPAPRDGKFGEDVQRLLAVLLVAASVEVGLDLIRPLPSVEDADDLRVSAVRHAERSTGPGLMRRVHIPSGIEWQRERSSASQRMTGRAQW